MCKARRRKYNVGLNSEVRLNEKEAKVKQDGRQDKKVSRHLRKGRVTRVKTEQSKRTRQWKL